MLPVERQNQIRQLILTKKTLKISELSEQFQVSEMTIHRDLKPLIEERLIRKSFGGISLIEEKDLVYPTQSQCAYCLKTYNPKMAYRLILTKNRVETACCAHCGLLRHRQLGEEVMQALCHDFFMNTTMSASLTWFVMDTSLHISCCQPQVLTFENREHAEKFIKGFGGDIYGFHDAMEVVQQKMQGDSTCCNRQM